MFHQHYQTCGKIKPDYRHCISQKAKQEIFSHYFLSIHAIDQTFIPLYDLIIFFKYAAEKTMYVFLVIEQTLNHYTTVVTPVCNVRKNIKFYPVSPVSCILLSDGLRVLA